MFWRTYGSVIGWMFFVGVVGTGAYFFVLFAWIAPSSSGVNVAPETMAIWGGFSGAVTAAAASVVYGVSVALWTRRPDRSVASRAWIGASSAGVGAFAFWALLGYIVGGPALLSWAVVATVAGVCAALTAGPFTALAVRRASRGPSVHGSGAV